MRGAADRARPLWPLCPRAGLSLEEIPRRGSTGGLRKSLNL